MKKIKLFALAVFAMLSTNAFAAVGDTKADGNYRYRVLSGTTAEIIGFVANQEVAAVEIPTQVTDPDATTTKYDVIAVAPEAFKDQTIITSVTIPDTKVATIKGGAFAGCTNLTTVTIGKAVTLIDNATAFTDLGAATTVVGTVYYTSQYGDGKYTETTATAVTAGQRFTGGTPLGAFAGCTKLATVNFETPATGVFTAIEAGTFAETAIVTLDLTKSHVQVLNQLFEEMNTTLTTVKLPATLTKINTTAFKNLATLATIDFEACAADFEIEANAFYGAPLIKTLSLPKKLKALKKDALTGSNINSLTIESSETAGLPTIQEVGGDKLTSLTISGAFKGVIGDDNVAKPAFKKLTSVVFKGNVVAGAITAGAFSYCDKLATVTFLGALEAAAVKDQAFVDYTSATKVYAGQSNYNADTNPHPLTITYNPASTTAPNAFVVTAFGKADGSFPATAEPAEIDYAKLVTTTAYAVTIKAAGIHNLYVSADPATFALTVAKGGSSSYYYAKLFATVPYKIAKTQPNGKDAYVYTAYVDQKDAAIYMENLHIYEGFYWIPANTPVIVKSKEADDIVLTEDDGLTYNSVMYKTQSATADATNEIQCDAADQTGLHLKETQKTKDFYFLAPFADFGFLWSKFKDERVIYGYTNGAYDTTKKSTSADFYVICPKIAAGSRLNVIWLDGSEEATAIQGVKKAAANDGAIYNLAGQKVNAAYKGVVIKDGKKYMQK
jgi:hypothetical protein